MCRVGSIEWWASLDDREVERELAHARNRRDAFSDNEHTPDAIMEQVARGIHESAIRRVARRVK